MDNNIEIRVRSRSKTVFGSHNKRNILRALDILHRGGVIFYYSDLTYGLAANALNQETVKRVYNLKGRHYTKPLSILANKRRLFEYSIVGEAIQENVDKLINKFWPGGLSLVLPKKPVIPNFVTANLPTVGLMCPDQLTIRLVDLADFPITATSANVSGDKPIIKPDAVNTFADQVDFILLDGICKYGESSTIIDLSNTKPKILRQGLVPINKLDWLFD